MVTFFKYHNYLGDSFKYNILDSARVDGGGSSYRLRE